jgi:hypothetical protein
MATSYAVKIKDKGEYIFQDEPLVVDNNFYLALKYSLLKVKLPNNSIQKLIGEEPIENKVYLIQ